MFSVRSQDVLRFSLVFVWLATALVSVLELRGQSAQLLAGAGMKDIRIASLLIICGAGIDAILGLWLWFRPGRRIYLMALAVMLVMTLLATVVNPEWWLHPLGPLTKNVPIAAVLLVLSRRSP